MQNLNHKAQALQLKTDEEGRALSPDEEVEMQALMDEFDLLQERIKFAGTGRQTEAQIPGIGGPQGRNIGTPGRRSDLALTGDTGGFQTFGEFALSVRDAGRIHKGGNIDPRLVRNQPTTYSSEGVGEEGGFSVPPYFRTEIWQKVTGEASLFGRTDRSTTPSNTIEMPADETTPWGTSGPQVYWDDEGERLTQSKIKLKSKTQRLNKVTSLVPVTSELVEDAPALDAYLRRVVPGRIDFALSLAIVQGPGAGKPLGILNSSSIIAVERESVDAIGFADLQGMLGELYAPLLPNAVFLVHPKVPEVLLNTYFPLVEYGVPSNIAVAAQPVYLPNAGIAQAPFGTLMGRPVIPSECCEPLGDKGDIILVDLSQYWTCMKIVGLKTDVSIHLWFDYDILAYRFILRFTGMPHWADKITGRDAVSQYSWAVVLDEAVES